MSLNKNDLSLDDKLKVLGIEDKKLDPKYINFLYVNLDKINKINKINNTNNNIVETKKKIVVNRKDPKYIVLLKLLNRIFTNIKKTTLSDLTDFKNVDRDDIIKDENITVFSEMEKEIFKYFDKSECGWYRRKMVQYYILTFLRAACESIGLSFVYAHKNVTKNSIVKTHVLYSIN